VNSEAQPPQGQVAEPTWSEERGGEAGPQTAALLRLLQLEADIRRIESVKELVFHLANESRGVLGYRQAFVLRKRQSWTLRAVSSVSAFDAQAPLNREIQALVTRIARLPDGGNALAVNVSDHAQSDMLRGYAFAQALWVPMRTRRGDIFAGILLLRENPWPETILPLAERLVATYSHAWEALAGRKLGRRFSFPRKLAFPLIAAALIGLGFLKLPLTVLAPAEVTGRDRVTVAAALNGVIDDVSVAPNVVVRSGDLLARFDDTELRNAAEIADRETIIAQARLEKLQNASFADRTAARELKIAEAELALAKADSALARDRLSRVEVRAPRAGLVVFEDARDLIGRPVSVGERLMEVVDPEDLEVTIRLPVDDSIVLRDGARVRVFLDSDPLNPVGAELTRRSYRASTQDDGGFAYTLTARAASEDLSAARLGSQGTAQIYGDDHRLFFIVFRRPFSWIRQTFGF
jgi:multidrug resistance efflux pump